MSQKINMEEILLKEINEVGNCRMCLVEVKGNNKLIPACTSKIKEGMEVTVSCAEGDTGNIYEGLLDIDIIDLCHL